MTSPWPSTVWGSPLLRGLDDRGRRELEASGELLEKSAGDAIYADGEPADVVYVVAKGEVVVGTLSRGAQATRTKRRAIEGDAVGEEALLGSHAVRDGEASCVSPSVLAAVPFVVLDRALVRAGGAELKDRTTRAVRRRILANRLRASGLLEGLDEGSIGELLDAAVHRETPRGDVLAQPSDAHENSVFVLDGLLGVHEVDVDGRPSPVGYLGRGDLFHEPSRARFGVSLSASGPSSVVFFPKALLETVVARGTGSLALASRGHVPEVQPVSTSTTAHVVRDLYRVQIARSLLVIDQDACVQCGHCVWSCGNAHDDGTPRLTRRGDKLLLPLLDARAEPQSRAVPLLLPNSCQHCKNPACLKDCPTGAIVRDGRGEVKIREDLCTGCGNCARGCPWENIQIVPRPATAAAAPPTFPDVAVKCDLCEGLAQGPACVAACPTEAIVRLDPLATPLVGSKAGAVELVPRGRRPAWPWVALAVGMGLAVSRSDLSSRTSGLVAAALSFGAVGYVGAKRVRPRSGKRPNARTDDSAAGLASVSTTRPHYVAHLAVGTFLVFLVAAHALHGGASTTGVASLVLFAVVGASGALAAVAYVVLPSRLSRLEREGILPEDVAKIREDLARRLFRALSGRSELVKKLYDKVLSPYRERLFGSLALVLSGRSVGQEERAIRKGIDALLEGRGADKLSGLPELVKLVVEERALRARVALSLVLRGLPPIHVAAAFAFLVLMVAHGIAAWSRGR